MKRFVQPIKLRIVDILNLDRMGEKYNVLTLNYVFMMIYVTLESVFVNTLLYTVHDDVSIVIFYRSITFVTAATTMFLAAYCNQRISPTFTVRVGAVFYLFVYILLFFGMNHMNILMYPIAFCVGTAGSFYFTGHNLLVSNYSRRDNRDIGIAILGIVQGIMTLLVPLISGFVISWMPGTTGYRVMFGIGMLAVGAQLYVQRNLAPVETSRKTSQLHLALKQLKQRVTYKLMLGYEFFRGFRDGAFGFLFNMLLFEIITEESLVGINTFLAGFASIVGSWMYGRFVKPDKRAKVTFIVTSLLMAFSLLLVFALNIATVMIFSLLNAFLALFILNSVNNTTYDVLCQNEITLRSMSEMLALREVSMTFGRLAGMGVLLLFRHSLEGYIWTTIILVASQFIVCYLLAKTQLILDRKRNRPAETEEISAISEPGEEPV